MSRISHAVRKLTKTINPRPSFAQKTSKLLPQRSKLWAARITVACMIVGW
jgi:hypothetical protein